MVRKAEVKRSTTETDIAVAVKIDGKGSAKVSSGIPFLDHMISLVAKHGFFDIELKAKGDIDVDFHHTVEDVGICLGQAFQKALGDKQGIRRYGDATVPMIDALATVVLDISARSNLVYRVEQSKAKVGEFDTELVEEFFRAFSTHLGVDLHINVLYGDNTHHIIEAVFKAFAKALDQATMIDDRIKGVLSTKGKL
jgi:imidazoleglycerol-phosphate dehydratase